MKTLNIVEAAYRGTLEEQDDTIIWIVHAMRAAGADMDVLLRGSAVACAVPGQDASGLSFGAVRQTCPPDLALDLARLVERGARVYCIEDDLGRRGLTAQDVVNGVRPVAREQLTQLFGTYDRIWHW